LLAQLTTQAAGLFVFSFSPGLAFPAAQITQRPNSTHNQPSCLLSLSVTDSWGPPVSSSPNLQPAASLWPCCAPPGAHPFPSPPPSMPWMLSGALIMRHRLPSIRNGLHQNSPTIHGCPPPRTAIADSSPPTSTL
jgi:hypothetical protein